MPNQHSFGTSPMSLQENLNIFTYSDRSDEKLFLRVGINSKANLVDFIKMLQGANASVLLFLLGEMSNSN